jgi:hypothetical protein
VPLKLWDLPGRYSNLTRQLERLHDVPTAHFLTSRASPVGCSGQVLLHQLGGLLRELAASLEVALSGAEHVHQG